MSADHVAALVTAIAAGITSVVLVAVVVVLGRRVRELGRTVEELRRETVPLVHDARVVVDQAATEMVRVGDVLDSAEAVSATVDSASRLAYRAFSNPVVKVLAYSTGLGSALRRFFGRHPSGGRPRHVLGQRPCPPGRAARPDARTAAGLAPPGAAPARGGAAVIRRPLWLAAGAALGAGGTLWARRRLERLSRRVRPTAVAGEIVSVVDRTRRAGRGPGARRASTPAGPRRSAVRTTCRRELGRPQVRAPR